LFLKGNFLFFKGELSNRMLLWAKVIDETVVTPEGLRRQKSRLEQFFHLPVVFVFDQLDSWQRKRLIERQVAFVQTKKQVYIPELFLQLDDTRSDQVIPNRNYQVLSFPAQTALLYHLERGSLNDLPASQIAGMLGYSAMTVTRIIRELKHLELIELRTGKERAFEFSQAGRNLWERALPVLRNPVKEIWYSDTLTDIGRVLASGETALAHYSMLAEPRVKQLAIGKEQFRSLRTMGRIPELNNRDGNFRIEVWQYDPMALVKNGELNVDRLSLYLCLRGSLNERVVGSLEEAMTGVLW